MEGSPLNNILKFLLVALTLCSCHNNRTYPYAIKDFRQKLQPHLAQIVEQGIVMYRDTLENMATDGELEKLSMSEHPILRAAAFREILKRESFNHFEKILGHLDDSALVFVDEGEFGIWDMLVSDYILQEAVWKTKEEKEKTIDQVLTQHNHLKSAYTILDSLKPQQKYYRFIKDMATRTKHKNLNDEYEFDFKVTEYALLGLAKFQKKEDIGIIKQILLKNIWRLSDISFRLMTKDPDPAYLDVLYDYHRTQFYKFSGVRPRGFTGIPADRAAPEDFIQAVVVQQNDRSAALLEDMLSILPKRTCMPDKEDIINEIIIAIWEHPCQAYVTLRGKNKEKAIALSKGILEIDLPVSLDTTKRIIRWYP